MNHREVLKVAASTLNNRNELYGSLDDCMYRASTHASLLLNKEVTPYEISIILMAVKLARIPPNPTYDDNYVDLVNYAAISSQFVQPIPQNPSPTDEVEREIRELARKFAPVQEASSDHPA